VDCEARDLGVQLLEISFHNFGKQLDKRIKNRADGKYDNFSDIERGMTLVCGCEARSMGTGKPFPCIETVDFEPRDVDYDAAAMLAEIPCLDDLLIVRPYDELHNIFYQSVVADSGMGEEQAQTPEAPARGSAAAQGKPRSTAATGAPKAADPPPAAKEQPAKAAPAPAAATYAPGDKVMHATHGRCEVLKVREDGKLVVEDVEENTHTVDASEVKPKGAKAAAEAPTAAPPAKKTAAELGLENGAKVQHATLGKVEILKISADGFSLTVEDADENVHKNVDVGLVQAAAVEAPAKAPRSRKAKDEAPAKEPAAAAAPAGGDADWDADWDK